MNWLRYGVLGLALCLACMTTAPSATGQTLQIKAADGDLPPEYMLMLLGNSPAMHEAVLGQFTLKLVDQFPMPKGNGSKVLKVKDEIGDELQIVLQAVFTERKEDPPVQWGLLSIYPYQDGTIQRTKEQEEALTRLCAKMSVAWAAQLEATLAHFSMEGNQREEELGRRRLQSTEVRLEVAMKQLDELRTALQDVEQQVSMPAAVLETQLSEAMSQQQVMELELAGLEARRAALEERINQLSIKAVDSADKDEVVTSLQNVVDVRTQQVETVSRARDAGQASPQEREMAVAQLATAKAALAEARRGAMRLQGGNALELLQNDLAQSFIRQEECRAKQVFLAKRVQELTEKLRIESMLVQPLRDKLPAAARRVESLEDAKFAAEVELERAASQRQPVQVRLLTPPESEAPAVEEKQ